MNALATCSKLAKAQYEREAAVWCSVVVELGPRVVEKSGPRHLEVFNLAYEYSEFEEPFDAAMLAGLRDELLLEAAGR
jgi:hypothetical protein